MSRIAVVVAGTFWLGSVSAGLGWLWSYSATPGAPSQTPTQWPRDSRIARNLHASTVLMFAHPHCPCTRASLGELAGLLTRVPHAATPVTIVFTTVAGTQPAWTDADLRTTAAAIPGVRILQDEGGAEARRFRASTSGQTLVYDAAGRLAFAGGITGARGHAGDNPGRTAVAELLVGRTAADVRTPVFGCSILGASAEPVPPHAHDVATR